MLSKSLLKFLRWCCSGSSSSAQRTAKPITKAKHRTKRAAIFPFHSVLLISKMPVESIRPTKMKLRTKRANEKKKKLEKNWWKRPHVKIIRFKVIALRARRAHPKRIPIGWATSECLATFAFLIYSILRVKRVWRTRTGAIVRHDAINGNTYLHLTNGNYRFN